MRRWRFYFWTNNRVRWGVDCVLSFTGWLGDFIAFEFTSTAIHQTTDNCRDLYPSDPIYCIEEISFNFPITAIQSYVLVTVVTNAAELLYNLTSSTSFQQQKINTKIKFLRRLFKIKCVKCFIVSCIYYCYKAQSSCRCLMGVCSVLK